MMIKIIERFFAVRDCIHLIHLNTISYSEHKALGKFYDNWIELADTFIETYQGKYSRIAGGINITASTDEDAVKYLKDLYLFVTNDVKVDVSDNDLKNILADMQQLINQTLYLLTLK